MMNVLMVAAGGAAGCLCRYGVALALPSQGGFPWAVFAVNMLGCFLFGLCAELIAGGILPKQAELPVLVGFLGGFTTFSSFAFNNHALWEHGRLGWLVFNVVAQNLGGVLLVVAGIAVARLR
jgi:CrcB protein